MLIEAAEPDPPPSGSCNFTTKHGTDYGAMMAGVHDHRRPDRVLFLLVQRKMAAGLTAGAVKG